LTQKYRYLFWELEKLGLTKIINFDHTNMAFKLQLQKFGFHSLKSS